MGDRDAGNGPKAPDTGCSLSSSPINANPLDWSANRERRRTPDDFDKRHGVDAPDTNQMIAQRLASIVPLPPASIPLRVIDPTPDQIDQAAQYHVLLQAAHEGDYIDYCHATKFKYDKIYAKGRGKLTEFVYESFVTQVSAWIGHLKTPGDFERLLTSMDLPVDTGFSLDDLQLTPESFIFPLNFGNPISIQILPPVLSTLEAMLVAQRLLHRALSDILTHEQWVSPSFNYSVADLSELSEAPGKDFDFTENPVSETAGKGYTRTATFEFIVDYVAPQATIATQAKDRTTRVNIRLPNNTVAEYTLGHALVSLRQIVTLAKVPHLSFITQESTAENWQLAAPFNNNVERSPRGLKFSFDFDFLRGPDGSICFNDLPHYFFTRVVINPLSGEPSFQSSSPHPVGYSGHGMCGKCFGKGYEDGSAHATADCPLVDACKFCWEVPDLEKALAVHCKKHCKVVKDLEGRARDEGNTIFPFVPVVQTSFAAQGQSIYSTQIPEDKLRSLR